MRIIFAIFLIFFLNTFLWSTGNIFENSANWDEIVAQAKKNAGNKKITQISKGKEIDLSIEKLWEKVAQAQENGLPRTAIKYLKEILKKTDKQKDYVNWLKALTKKIVLESNLEGNKAAVKVKEMKELIKSTSTQLKPVLQVILAEWYYHYFLQNRWRFSKRSKTSGYDSDDFTTWDLPKIYHEIDKLFTEALKNADYLKKIKLKSLYGFIKKGNVPFIIRPTLYDFLVFQAIDFYMKGEMDAALPEDAFEIDIYSGAFSHWKEFLKYQPKTTDTSSPKLKVLKLFQKVISFYASQKNWDALLDADLKRLKYVKNHAYGTEKEKEELYLKRLKELEQEFGSLKEAGMILAAEAEIYQKRGDLVKAHQIAKRGFLQYARSYGSSLCEVILNQIERKELSLKMVRIIRNDDKEDKKITVTYRNIDKIYFRIYQGNPLSFVGKEYEGPYDMNQDKLNQLFSKIPVKEWKVDLVETKDFKEKTVKLDLPDLKKGFYWIWASPTSNFTGSSKLVYQWFWISNLCVSVIKRTGKILAVVTDSKTGKPLSGVTVKRIIYSYRKSEFDKNSYTTNEKGICSLKRKDSSDSDFYLLLENGDDKLLSPDSIYLSRRYSYSNIIKGTTFFTDRSLYRPGQTIYFKGISYIVNKDTNDYRVAPNQTIKVVFRDHNGKVISKKTFQTNDFGSFSGTFVAPTGVLTGRMRISASYPYSGSTYVNVEEYKRPKFLVELKKPTTPAKLDTLVTLKGTAKTYSGAPLDNAKVRYRVVRKVSFPFWCFRYFFVPPVNINSQEIAHGVTKTGENGEFTISFQAKSDKLALKKYNPTFLFEVYADVTDTSGETRTDSLVLKIGYSDLKLEVERKDFYFSSQLQLITIKSHSLMGNPYQTSGEIKIYSLKQPSKPKREELNGSSYYYRREESGVKGEDWERWPKGELVYQADFKTSLEGKKGISLHLKPGLYRIELEAKDRYKQKATAISSLLVLPDKKNDKFPFKFPFWAQILKNSYKIGEKAEILVGTGYSEGSVLVLWSKKGEIKKLYWTKKGRTQWLLTFPIEKGDRGGFYVYLYFVKENRVYQKAIKVNVPWNNKELKISTRVFKSKLWPGSENKWIIHIEGKEAPIKAAEIVATLYDSSLDAYLPHQWRKWNFFWQADRDFDISSWNRLWSWRDWRDQWNSYIGTPSRQYPSFPRDVVANFYSFGFSRYFTKSKGIMMRRGPQLLTESLDMAPAPRTKLKKTANKVEIAGKNKEKTKEKTSPKVQIRKNLAETAFFYPHLVMDKDGNVDIEFKIPEALTKWKLMVFAHGKGLERGLLVKYAVTQKDLMVEPLAPRFLRVGDELYFPVKVINLSDKKLSGVVSLSFSSLLGNENWNERLGLKTGEIKFNLKAGRSKSYFFKIKVPSGIDFLKYTAVAKCDEFSDGIEGMLPVLSSRVMVTDSWPLWVNGPGEKTFSWPDLKKVLESGSVEPQRMVVQIASNPAWYALLALPYLSEERYECSESVFQRYYANSLGAYIVNSNPKIKTIFDYWRKYSPQTLKSPLEKNQSLKLVALEETPWVNEAKSETEARFKIASFFDENNLKKELERAYQKLKKNQSSSGSWSWFPGGRPNFYMTLYIVTGFGRLRHLGVPVKMDLALKALSYLDKEVVKMYHQELKEKFYWRKTISYTMAFYLYCRSFYLKDKPISGELKKAVDYYLGKGVKYWLDLNSRLGQGYLALAFSRFNDKITANKIVKSIKERSVYEEEMGRYWKEGEISWWWYRAPIETQALMIEMFAEVTHDMKAVEECKRWLLKQKQTQNWKTTKATSDAVYALLLRGRDLLSSTKLVETYLGGEKVKIEKAEAGTGFYEKIFSPSQIKDDFYQVKLKKVDKGIAWGGLYFQYFEDMSEVKSHGTKHLNLTKSIFVRRDTKSGPVIVPLEKTKLKVGDLIKVRIVLKVDRDMEYVHLKDYRGSGLEPINVLSGYKYQDGLAYYQSTKDTATHFFIDYLPKGTYVFEYPLRVFQSGKYQTGFANIQCMYAPEFSSHSNSIWLEVEKGK